MIAPMNIILNHNKSVQNATKVAKHAMAAANINVLLVIHSISINKIIINA